LLASIAEKKAITDDIKANLKQVLEDFKHNWSKESSEADLAAAPTRAATTAAAQPA
jgi:hypothetical protein